MQPASRPFASPLGHGHTGSNPPFAGDLAQPSGLMLQMGLRYGQTLLQEGMQQSEQGLLQYMPLYHNLRRYFAVDNRYVRRKLALLLFPFRRSYPRAADATWDTTAEGAHATLNGAASYDAPLGLTPTNLAVSGSPSHGSAIHSPAAATPALSRRGPVPAALPTQDPFAFDLYIPLMSAITYVIICAFLFGLLHKRPVTAEYLVSTTTMLVIWFVLETLALKLVAYLLPVTPSVALLDTVALCGYKYVYICLILLIQYQLSGRTGLAIMVSCVAYMLFANSFFACRSVTRLYAREDGRVSPRVRLLSYIAALAQAPIFLWMCIRPYRS